MRMCATDVAPINAPTYHLRISTFQPVTVKGVGDNGSRSLRSLWTLQRDQPVSNRIDREVWGQGTEGGGGSVL